MSSDIELSNYIKKSLEKGQLRESIIDSLLAIGWQKSVIDEQFLIIENANNLDMPLPPINQNSNFSQSLLDVSLDSSQTQKGNKKPLSNKLIATVAILGSVLMGVGVILWIASNWEEIPRFGKVALLFLIILVNYASSYYLLFIKNYQKTGRALVFLGCILFGAGIILIAQIFNIESESGIALLLWSLFILPLVFILRLGSSLALSVALFFLWGAYKTFGGLPIISGLGGGRPLMTVLEINYWYLILLLSVFIPLTYYIRSLKIQALNIITLGIWIVAAIEINFAQILMEMASKHQKFSINDRSVVVVTFMFIVVYSIAIYFIGKAHLTYENWKKFSLSYIRPATIILFGIFFALSFKDLLKGALYIGNGFAKRSENVSVLKIETTPYFISFYIILVLIAVIAAYLSYTRNQLKTKSDILEMASLFFLMLLSSAFTYLVPFNKDTVNLFSIIFNLILFLGSLGLIFVGHIQREKYFINIGLLFFAIGIIARYFDWAYTLMDRSLFFILGGIILIALSIFVERQRRKLLQDIA